MLYLCLVLWTRRQVSWDDSHESDVCKPVQGGLLEDLLIIRHKSFTANYLAVASISITVCCVRCISVSNCPVCDFSRSARTGDDIREIRSILDTSLSNVAREPNLDSILLEQEAKKLDESLGGTGIPGMLPISDMVLQVVAAHVYHAVTSLVVIGKFSCWLWFGKIYQKETW